MSAYEHAFAAYPNDGERPGIRQSLLSDFDDCALGARMGLDYSNFDGHPQGRGIIFHRAAAKAFRDMAKMGENEMEVDVGLAILQECLRQADVPQDEIVNIPMNQVADLYWTMKKWCYDNVWSIDTLYEVEQRLQAKVYYPNPDGGIVERVVSGQLDALFLQGDELEHAVVLDHKDTWALPPDTGISFEGFFQQRFYSYLVMKNIPSVQQVTLREFYVRYSQPREATLFRSQLDDIEAELSALCERFDRAYHQAVEAEATEPEQYKAFFRPAPGKHCQWCPRPTACPIFPTARREGRITEDGDAAKVAAQVIVAEAALKQAKGALRTWVEGHGPVPVKDAKGKRVYGFQESTRTERPSKDDVKQAQETGVNPITLYKTKPTTRFGAHVPKPPEPTSEEDLFPFLEAAKKGNGRRSAA